MVQLADHQIKCCVARGTAKSGECEQAAEQRQKGRNHAERFCTFTLQGVKDTSEQTDPAAVGKILPGPMDCPFMIPLLAYE